MKQLELKPTVPTGIRVGAGTLSPTSSDSLSEALDKCRDRLYCPVKSHRLYGSEILCNNDKRMQPCIHHSYVWIVSYRLDHGHQ